MRKRTIIAAAFLFFTISSAQAVDIQVESFNCLFRGRVGKCSQSTTEGEKIIILLQRDYIVAEHPTATTWSNINWRITSASVDEIEAEGDFNGVPATQLTCMITTNGCTLIYDKDLISSK